MEQLIDLQENLNFEPEQQMDDDPFNVEWWSLANEPGKMGEYHPLCAELGNLQSLFELLTTFERGNLIRKDGVLISPDGIFEGVKLTFDQDTNWSKIAENILQNEIGSTEMSLDWRDKNFVFTFLEYFTGSKDRVNKFFEDQVRNGLISDDLSEFFNEEGDWNDNSRLVLNISDQTINKFIDRFCNGNDGTDDGNDDDDDPNNRPSSGLVIIGQFGYEPAVKYGELPLAAIILNQTGKVDVGATLAQEGDIWSLGTIPLNRDFESTTITLSESPDPNYAKQLNAFFASYYTENDYFKFDELRSERMKPELVYPISAGSAIGFSSSDIDSIVRSFEQSLKDLTDVGEEALKDEAFLQAVQNMNPPKDGGLAIGLSVAALAVLGTLALRFGLKSKTA